jgi:predicted transcriptional regulator
MKTKEEIWINRIKQIREILEEQKLTMIYAQKEDERTAIVVQMEEKIEFGLYFYENEDYENLGMLVHDKLMRAYIDALMLKTKQGRLIK